VNRPVDEQRLEASFVGRADRRSGVFETIRVEDGVPLRVDQHIARLGRSVDTLYGKRLSGDLAADVRATARTQQGRAAIRVSAVPAENGELRVDMEFRDFPVRGVPVELRPVTLPGGLGAHKWRDRRSIDAWGETQGTPLIVDVDGSVLEAAWANVLVVCDTEWVTPELDGRLLPGVTRSALIAAGQTAGYRVSTRRVSLEDVTAADAILLTSALTLVTWGVLDGWTGSTLVASDLASRFARELIA
jgi:para-aminobenzoate synthetase / 4-amino-4-deoxychorismate lyase